MASIVKGRNYERHYIALAEMPPRDPVRCFPSRDIKVTTKEAVETSIDEGSRRFYTHGKNTFVNDYVINHVAKFARELDPRVDHILVEDKPYNILAKGFDMEGNIVYLIEKDVVIDNTESKLASEALVYHGEQELIKRAQEALDAQGKHETLKRSDLNLYKEPEYEMPEHMRKEPQGMLDAFQSAKRKWQDWRQK